MNDKGLQIYVQGNSHTYIDRTLLSDNLSWADWGTVLNLFEINETAFMSDTSIKDSAKYARKFVKNNTRFKRIKVWISLDLFRHIQDRDKLTKFLKKKPFNANLRLQYLYLRQRLIRQIIEKFET